MKTKATPTHLDRLDHVRHVSQLLMKQSQTAITEAQRNEMVANKLHTEATNAKENARTALESLYADRADGKRVTESQISEAQATLSAAARAADISAPEEAGLRAAAAKGYAKAAEAQRSLATLRESSKMVFRTAMHERIRLSCKEFDAALDGFKAKYIQHHAEMNAIESELQALGFPYGDGEFFANRSSAVIELPITRTKGSAHRLASIDVSRDLANEKCRIAKELRQFIP